jgi:hypothetical protein
MILHNHIWLEDDGLDLSRIHRGILSAHDLLVPDLDLGEMWVQ